MGPRFRGDDTGDVCPVTVDPDSSNAVCDIAQARGGAVRI